MLFDETGRLRLLPTCRLLVWMVIAASVSAWAVSEFLEPAHPGRFSIENRIPNLVTGREIDA